MPTVTGSFAATGNSSSAEGSFAEMILGGTFVGTITLQVAIPGAAGADQWVTVSSQTAPGRFTSEGPVGRKWRLSCTAYTSGTAYYSLGTAVNTVLTD